MSGILFLVVIPAVIASAFGIFVLYSILPDIEQRLFIYEGFPDIHHLNVQRLEDTQP